MDEEKLIIISFQDEILESNFDVFHLQNLNFYANENGLNILDVLEFEAFVFVNVDFK